MDEKGGQREIYSSINEILPVIGGFGTFQILLTSVFCVMIMPGTFQILIMYFAALDPKWQCAANSTVCTQNGTFTSEDTSRCNMSRSDWEFTQPPSYSIVTQFDIYCDKTWMVHLTTSFLFIGWGVGAVVLGWIADNYGRKIVLFPSCFIIMVAGLISAFSPGIAFLVVCRFIIGFFTPGTGVQMVVLASEFVNNKFRPLAVNVIWLFFAVALCLLGVKAYFIREWKLLIIVNSAPYIFIMLFYKFIPESMRWLHLHGKMDRLVVLIRNIAKWNKKTLPEDFTMLPLKQSNTMHKTNPLDLFKTKKGTLDTLNQGYAWLVNGMVYYGLSLAADDLGGSLYTNFILITAVEFPASVLGIYLCEKIGRKKTVAGGMAFGSVACIAVAFVPTTGSIKIIRVILGVLGKSAITVSFNSIYTWSLEIFPTDIRAEAMGFLQITSRTGAASSPWIAKGLKALHPVAPFIFMGTLSLIASVLLLFLPETKGKLTQELSDDAREDKAVKSNEDSELKAMADQSNNFA